MNDLPLEETGFPGVRVAIDPAYLAVVADEPLRMITTAALGAELGEAARFLAIPATPGIECDTPETTLVATARSIGLEEPFVGFVTAVKLTNAVVACEEAAGVRVLCVATVGVANASRPGEELAGLFLPGTINLVIVVDADLTAAALQEALAIAVEAKAITVYEGGATTLTGLPATGTSTDAIAVACTGRGDAHRYAGSVTPVGYAVARAVRSAVGEGLPAALQRMEEARR